jgi:hypothetical protein
MEDKWWFKVSYVCIVVMLPGVGHGQPREVVVPQ